MKRLFVPLLALATLFFLGSSAYAQGHGGHPPVTPAGGAASAHGNSASADGGHVSSNTPASQSSPASVLSRNPNVGPALTQALAKQGINVTDLNSTCSAFRTLGQCIAALHINQKFSGCSMTALSGAKSLGAAIQTCNPQSDAKTAKAEAKNATKLANQEIKASSAS